MFKALDRRPWTVPAVVFVLTAAALLVLRLFGIFVSFTSSGLRAQFYSSVTGSSSSLLGFLIAAVTILAAFGKRQTSIPQEQRREQALADARTRLVVVLLAAALSMLVTLVSASLALAGSGSPDRLLILDMLIVSGAAAGIMGITYGGIGLALAVAERAR